MNQQTIDYIKDRANESETGSIKAVSCPDVRALLEEREALIEALTELDNWTNLPAMKQAMINEGYMAKWATIKHKVYLALRKVIDP